jgi:replication-associated recombination protein RarA
MSTVTNNSFVVKYAPQNLDDVVFENDEIQGELQRYVDGNREPLILYGPNGTGKTTMATHLANREYDRSPNSNIFQLGALIYKRKDFKTDNALFMDLRERLGYMQSVVLLDEIDLMGKKLIDNIKGFIDHSQDTVLFIVTTNHFSQLDQGHISRSNCLHIKPAPLDRWKPRIEKILDAEGVPVPDDEALEEMLKVSKGDHRQFLYELQRYTEDVRRQVAAE